MDAFLWWANGNGRRRKLFQAGFARRAICSKGSTSTRVANVPAEPIRLTYVSTLRFDVTVAEIDELVAKAATFNRKHGITGVLAIDNSRVCQILEGPAEPVDRLFASIEKDPRHHSVTQIEHRPIGSSSFESWGMVRRDMIDMVLFALGA